MYIHAIIFGMEMAFSVTYAPREKDPRQSQDLKHRKKPL